MIIYRSEGDDSKTIDDLIEAVNSLDSTNIYEVGGFNVTVADTGEQTLATEDDSIVLDSANAKIYIRDITTGTGAFGEKGIQLDYNAGTVRAYIGDGANQYVQYDGTNLSWKGTNTSLTAAGVFTATDAILTGSITATSGTIGSFTIGTYLYTGAKTAWNDANAGVHLGSDGIGIGNNVFTVDGATGALVATSATITGSVTATSGRIANWYINTNTISSGAVEATSNVLIDSANSLIRLGPSATDYLSLDGANKRIRSSNYASGPQGEGFTLEPELLEVGNIRARGKISTSVFEKDAISSVGGSVIVANADILDADMTSADNSTVTIVGDATFLLNDILVINDGDDLEYMRVTDATGAPLYVVTRDLAGTYGANSNPAWKKGTCITVFGNSNGTDTFSGGWLYMNGGGTDAPYYAVVRRTGVASVEFTQYARFGNLAGLLTIYPTGTPVYGFAVGDDDDYIAIDPTNNLRINTSTANAITINQGGNIALNYGGSITFSSIPNPTACTADLAGADGNVDIGAHSYKITYVNAYGETDFGTASNVVTTVAGNKKVNLTNIPVSTVGAVTTKYIYRTKAGGSLYYYLDSIAAGDTTYLDDIADAGLTGGWNDRENTTAGRIVYDTKDSGFAGIYNTYWGQNSLHDLTFGDDNVAIGSAALYHNTYGSGNTAIGMQALHTNTIGCSQVAVGGYALANSNPVGAGTGGNIAVGYSALNLTTTGMANIAIGYEAGVSNLVGDSNIYIGYNAGHDSVGSDNIFIGDSAGYNEVGSNKLYIENSDSTTPLIYGEFDNNLVYIHGDLYVRNGETLIINSAGNDKNLTIYHDDTNALYNASSGDHLFNGHLQVRDGFSFYAMSAGNDKYVDIRHDDTDGHIVTSSGDLHLEPAGGEVIATNGAKFQANSAGDDKNIQVYHNDTDGHITTSSGDLHLEPAGGYVKVPFVGFRARLTTEQSNITDSTYTITACNTEDFDSGGNYNNGTYTFTAPVAGYYFFKGMVRWKTSTIGLDKYVETRILAAGSSSQSVGRTSQTKSTSGYAIMNECCGTVLLAAADTVVLHAYHINGDNTPDIDGGTFEGYLITRT